MNPAFLSFVVVLVMAQLTLPRRYAFVPLLISACHVGNIEFLGEFSLPRLLILIGLARSIIGGHFRWSSSNPVDVLCVVFAFAAIITAGAHLDAGYNPYIANTGLILNVCGSYLYGRAFLQREDWPEIYARMTVFILLPLAFFMTAEKITARNSYSVLGITGEGSSIREGKVRARGPFRHPILAGTAGAASFPLCLILWRRWRSMAILGIGACGCITFASNSSGPMSAFLASAGLLWFWRKRQLMPHVRTTVIMTIIFLMIVMNRPFYYIMDSIDLTGGSTGWHRARLIEMSIEHLSEWWLAGTDHTRHWMPTGVSWNPNHTDITNYYLHLGVTGGLPLTITLIAIIWQCGKNVLRCISLVPGQDKPHEFAIWCLGTALFAHALSFISISYFDQMYVLFYLLVGGIAGLRDENRFVLLPSDQ